MIPEASGRIAAGRGNRAGFSLAEVLVSMTILIALLTLLFGASEGAARFWNRAEQRRAPLREAGAALHQIESDLRGAVITADPSSLAVRREAGGDSLFCLVRHSGDDGDGTGAEREGLCATAFFTADDPSERDCRNLYRFHASGDRVLEALRSGSLEGLHAGLSPASPGTELLARHVVRLECRPAIPGPWPPREFVVTVTAVDPSVARELARHPDRREDLLRARGTALSAVVPLPSPRETVSPP